MINRENWKLIRNYIGYRKELDQLSPASIRLEETWLKFILDWVADRPFSSCPTIRPTFPEYVLVYQKQDGSGKLSPIYVRKIIACSKRFLGWLLKHKKPFAGKITEAWLDSIRCPRLENETTEHEFVSLEEIIAIANAPVESLREERARAAAVFLFLSGMRIGAFVTLPIKAVDLSKKKIFQWPSLGVKTKNTKKAITFLFDIPEIFHVVKEWDDQIRKNLPEDALWFAPLSPETGGFDSGIKEIGEHRSSRATKDLKEWMNRVELPYHSPHKFRHGNAIYGLTNAETIADAKAVSANLMHKNISITDGVYGIFSTAEVSKRISGLGHKIPTGGVSNEQLAKQLEDMAKTLRGD